MNELKVGDYIEITKTFGKHLTVGKEYEVTDVDSSGSPELIDDDGDQIFLRCSEYVKVEGTAMKDWLISELKVGERFKYHTFEGMVTDNSEGLVQTVILDGYFTGGHTEGSSVNLVPRTKVTKIDKYGRELPKVTVKEITFLEAIERIKNFENVQYVNNKGMSIEVCPVTELNKLSEYADDFYDLKNKGKWFIKEQ